MAEQKDRNPIEVLAAEFVDRHRRGEHPTLEEYVEHNPELAEAIQDLFPTILAMEQLKAHKESSSTPRKNLLGPNLNERLGDYILLREIGRGGMGIVYEAEQESLGRRVALKVLPRQSFDDEKKLQRFQREAQTAAKLHHTNIVPIFGVGEQDGFHYYVMQFIPGLGLDAVLKAMRQSETGATATNADPPQSGSDSVTLMPAQAVQALRSERFQQRQETASSASQERPRPSSTPTPASATDSTDTKIGPDSSENGHHGPASDRGYWRSVARVGVQVGDALDYAHGQGTLHRDIKPANLILDAHGVVWVTDFGLAKVVEQAHLTRSSDLVGTLQYMAPEQFRGDYDVRSDIYCLGLTLYELLTLRPANADVSRSGLIHKVTHGTPTAPRKLRPGIPDDLEVIVLKAISKDPTHRYQTAAELAEDLQNFLEDRPINARRTTAIEHAWRWCRRNKAVASLSMVALLLLIATTVIGYVGWVMTNTAFEKEIQSAKRAEENLKLSLKAFGDIFEDIAGGDRLQPVTEDPDTSDLESIAGTEAEDTPPQPAVARTVVSEQDAALLQRILRFYDRFAEANAGNKSLHEETAKAHFRIGKIHSRLNHFDHARKAYQHSLDMYEELGRKESGNKGYRDEKAAIHNDLGQTLRNHYRWAEASRQHWKVLTLMGVDPTSDNKVTPDTVRGQYELARAYRFLARRQRDRQNRQQFLERSLELIEGLLAKAPKNHHFRLAKAMSCGSLADLHAAVDPADAIARKTEAIHVLEALAEDFPNAGQFRYELARVVAPSMRFARVDYRGNPRSKAELAEIAKQLRRAKVIGERLVREFPTVTAYKSSLLQHCRSLGSIHRHLGKNKDAEPCYRRVVALREELVSLLGASPWSWQWLNERDRLNESRIDLARVLIANKKPEPALKELEACLALIAELDAEKPGRSNAAGRLWSIHRTMARALRLQGDEDGARDHEKQGKEASRRWAHSAIKRGASDRGRR